MSLEHVQTDVWGLDVVFLSIGLYKAVSLGNAVAECCCLTDSQRSNPMHQLFFCAIGHFKLPIKPQEEGCLFIYTQEAKLKDTIHHSGKEITERERERSHVHHQANLLHLYFYYKCSFPCFDFFHFILFYLYFLIIFLFLFAVLCCLIGYGLHLISYTKIRQNTTFRKTPFRPIHSPNFLKNVLNK